LNKKILGFSLIEVMFIVAIAGMLLTIIMPSVFRMRTRARIAQTKANLGVIRRAVEAEWAIEGDYPPWVDVRESNLPGSLNGARDCEMLRGGDMPDNPFSTSDKWGGTDRDVVYNVSSQKGSLVWGGGLGWCYNSNTGEFWANTSSPGINENTF